MIYISIGSNLGNKLNNLQNALSKIKQSSFTIIKQSPIIETDALLPEGAPELWNKSFFNMVIGGETKESPHTLLHQLQCIENEMGRDNPHPKWAPRIIDLDILLIDGLCIDDENFKVPHSELLHRPFLIHLLAMIAPTISHPITKKIFVEIAHQQNVNCCFTRSLVANPELIGVVNITLDSFSDGGRFFNPKNAIEQVVKLHEEGASVIELGAQSTRPGAILESPAKEYTHLKIVLDELLPLINQKQLRVSIDSFNEETLVKILPRYPIDWVNDVKGDLDNSLLSHIASSGQKLLAMHSLSIPPNQENIITLKQPSINVIIEWAKKKIDHLMQCGFVKNQIILDPGIGFNKTPYQSLAIIDDIAQLKSLGMRICVGHSRKSFLNIFNCRHSQERDLESIAISRYLTEQGVDYLRVHNIADHQRFLTANNFTTSTQGERYDFFKSTE